MREKSKRSRPHEAEGNRERRALFGMAVALLFLLPLVFSTAVQAIYSLPKFILLLTVAAVLLFLLVRVMSGPGAAFALLKSKQTKLVGLYFAAITLSAAFGVAPRVSWFGTTSNFMGWLSHLGFLICAVALLVGIGTSALRLQMTLWAMAACGGVVSLYAVIQALGVEPFVSPAVYTFNSAAGAVLRVCSSLGHSNYLGNFLLYTMPLSVGLAALARGKTMWLAVLIFVLSLTAILASGVRGAWVGLLIGAVVFALLEGRAALAGALFADRQWRVPILAGAAVSLLLALVVVLVSPASRSVAERLRSLRQEGLSSSGRLLLWRDALKMVPAYAVLGCGPEGFRKAFLAYKSKELAQLSPTQNNESAHNALLDNALSYGVLGAVLYLAVIISTLRLLVRARGRAPSAGWRLVLSSLVAAFAAALAHQVFIFNQLSTGLYFFAFLALAAAAANVFPDGPVPSANKATTETSGTGGWLRQSLTAATAVLVLAAAWYAVGLVTSEVAFTRLFSPPVAGNFAALTQQGERVTQSPMPTGAYHFLYARALDTYARTLASPGAALRSGNPAEVRQQALQLATQHVERSLAHTNTPDLNYSLLASLALTTGDTEKLHAAATEAVRYDPNNFHTRWLMAEAALARGDKEQAAREAELALEIKPESPQAAFALTRARNAGDADAYSEAEMLIARQRNLARKRGAEQLIQAARKLTQAGKWEKAKTKLQTALVSTDGNCADCRRELASLYESMQRYEKAIPEWEAFLNQTTDPEVIARTKAHIELLRQKSASR